MSIRRTTTLRNTAGFSAVELLITLFVAAAFLVAGYQLFNAVITDGGDTRAESRAGNIAYEYLRTYSDSAANPCVALTPLVQSPVTVEGLSNATISVTITCPVKDAPSISNVEARITYNTPEKTVRHATYVDKSRGASPTVEVTNGLLGWWKLNGNGLSEVGDAHMTNNNGASASFGQNGQANGSMAFNRTFRQSLSSSDSFSNKLVGVQAFTMTGWIYPPSNPPSHSGFFGVRDTNVMANGAYLLQLNGTNTIECRIAANGVVANPATAASITPNTWQFVALVYTGSALQCYVNSSVTSTTANTLNWQTNFQNSSLPMEIGSLMGPDSSYIGSSTIDDVRVYSRALSASELTQLRSGGGK